MFCFSLIIVFKLIAVTTTGGISFDEDDICMSFGESTVTSNLHQLTCVNYNQAVTGENESTHTHICMRERERETDRKADRLHKH